MSVTTQLVESVKHCARSAGTSAVTDLLAISAETSTKRYLYLSQVIEFITYKKFHNR